MSAVIYCRSRQEIDDDALCTCHSLITDDLKQVVAGRLLYRGPQRQKLQELHAECEEAINGGPRRCFGSLTYAASLYARYQHILSNF